MVRRVELVAQAKVNLLLRVLCREEGGFHALETLFLRLELSDRVVLEAGGDGVRLEVDGDSRVPSDPSNLCWQAAEAIARATDTRPSVRIRLEKRIPVGGGLGGGSADAAAVLHGMNTLLGEPLSLAGLLGLAGELGSDVPFAVAGAGMALAWERGRRLLPMPPPPPRPVLLLVPDFAISTRDAYAWLDEDRLRTVPDAPAARVLPSVGELAGWDTLQRIAGNDLEAPVFERHPTLAEARGELRAAGAAPALLCGSGSCLLGVFRDRAERDEAASRLEGRWGWSLVRTRTAGPS